MSLHPRVTDSSAHIPVSRMIRLCNEGEDILTKEELRHFAECATCRDLLQEAMRNVVEESSEK